MPDLAREDPLYAWREALRALLPPGAAGSTPETLHALFAPLQRQSELLEEGFRLQARLQWEMFLAPMEDLVRLVEDTARPMREGAAAFEQAAAALEQVARVLGAQAAAVEATGEALRQRLELLQRTSGVAVHEASEPRPGASG